jgi:hypothetical protein
LDQEASGIVTGSEEILTAVSSKHSLNARVINDLIKDLLFVWQELGKSRNTIVAFQVYLVISDLNLPKYIFPILN